MNARRIRQATFGVFAIGLLLQAGCDGGQNVTAPAIQQRRDGIAQATAKRDACPYRPSFVQLREAVRAVEGAAALAALYGFAANPANESADACQSIALDAAISARESALVTLRLADGRSLPAQASYRCDAVMPKTAACNGVVEDGTARPFSTGVTPIVLGGPLKATVRSKLPGATLDAVYSVRVADLLDGGGVQRLPVDAPVTLAPGEILMATVAIYRAPRAGKFRKFVWYYK